MSFCHNCAAEVLGDARFCDRCGAVVSNELPPEAKAVEPVQCAAAVPPHVIGARPSRFSGVLHLIMGGLLYCSASVVQASAVVGEFTFRLSYNWILFGLLPIVIGLSMAILPPQKARFSLLLGYLDLLLIIGWWYPVFGIINFWDIESTMRFYGVSLIVTTLIVIGLLKATIGFKKVGWAKRPNP